MGHRVLAVANLYPPNALGGFERSCAASVGRMKARGHDVAVLTGAVGDPAHEEAEIHRVLPLQKEPPHPFGFPRELWWHVRSKRAAAGVAGLRPDVVSFWGTSWISRAALRVVAAAGPTVAIAYDYGLLEHLTVKPIASRPGWKHGYDSTMARLYRRVGAEALPLPSFFVFCSNAIRRIYEDALGPLPGIVVPHGVFIPPHRSPLQRNGSLRVGGVGRFVPEKGFDVLIAAAEEIARQGGTDEVEIEIRGTTPDAGHHKHLLEASVRARRAGARIELGPPLPGPEAVARWMETKDCIVSPSTWEEPLALVPLEAMAAGRAVVSTPTGGSLELLEDGTNSLIVPAGDAAALAVALLRLSRDVALTERIAAAGYEQVSRHNREEVQGALIDDAILSRVVSGEPAS